MNARRDRLGVAGYAGYVDGYAAGYGGYACGCCGRIARFVGVLLDHHRLRQRGRRGARELLGEQADRVVQSILEGRVTIGGGQSPETVRRHKPKPTVRERRQKRRVNSTVSTFFRRDWSGLRKSLIPPRWARVRI